MKYIKEILVLVLLFLIFIGLFPRQATACSCAYPESVKDELNRKTAVFSGRVIKMEEENKISYIKSSADPIKVLFEVTDSWKGVDSSQVIVSAARSSASCGYEFELDKEYIVYAYGEINNLETGLCERTALLSAAGDDLAMLGQGKSPTKQVDLQNELGDSNVFLYLAISVIILVIGLLFRKKMKKS